MKLNFLAKRQVEFEDAKIIWRNFEGKAGEFNDEGEREFHIVIPDMEMAQQLIDDVNEDGVGWNVRIRAPKIEGDMPFITLKVKVNFNDRGPKVFLESDGRKIRLTEDTIKRLDFIDIKSCDIRLNPSDRTVRGTSYRTAYLDAMWVVQEVDKYESRFAEEEYPEE